MTENNTFRAPSSLTNKKHSEFLKEINEVKRKKKNVFPVSE